MQALRAIRAGSSGRLLEQRASVMELISALFGRARSRYVPGRRADRQRVIFAGQGGQCGCYLGEAGADVGGHGSSSAAMVFVPGVGLGGGEPEVALDPGQGRVADPVRADLLGCDPREMASQSLPEVVVAPGGYWPAVGVPQQGPAQGEATPAFPVGEQM